MGNLTVKQEDIKSAIKKETIQDIPKVSDRLYLLGCRLQSIQSNLRGSYYSQNEPAVA